MTLREFAPPRVSLGVVDLALADPSPDYTRADIQPQDPEAREARLQLISRLATFGKSRSNRHPVELHPNNIYVNLAFPGLQKPVVVGIGRTEPSLTIKHPNHFRQSRIAGPFTAYRARVVDSRWSASSPTVHNCLIFKGEKTMLVLESWGTIQELPTDLTKLQRDYTFLPPDWETKLRPKKIAEINS